MEDGAKREFEEETGISLDGCDLKYLQRSGDITGGKKIHAYLCEGTGEEKYICSNIITSGFRCGQPENEEGRYFNIAEALQVVHANQKKLIELFMRTIITV